MRVEIIDRTFFPQPLYTPVGRINPEPQKAMEYYVFLRETWLYTHPKTTEIPAVALRPVFTPEEGYEVVTQIFIPPLKQNCE